MSSSTATKAMRMARSFRLAAARTRSTAAVTTSATRYLSTLHGTMVTPKPVEPHFAVRQTRRHMSATPLHNFTISDLSVEEYHNLSEEALDLLLTELEGIVEESDQSGWEVEYSSGVLTLNLGDKGTYVLNKQPPNKQIWLSSPLSGPKRYDYDANQRVWFYKHDGKTLGTLLEQELRKLMGQEVKFTLESH